MIIHIFSSENTFVKPFVKLLKECFSTSDHCVLILSDKKQIVYPEESGMDEISNLFVKKILKKAEKIICHSLFNPKIIISFCFSRQILQKTYWVIWGGDLHFYEISKSSYKYRVLEVFRRYFIKRISGICTLAEGDYVLLKKWYQTDAKQYSVLYAVDHDLVERVVAESKKEKPDQKKRVLLGNSATQSNLHLEILEKLYDNKVIFDELLCPLSYGDKNYAEKVEQYGRERFGDRFVPIKKFVPQNEYISILNSVDVAILNNNRQQALGTIYLLALLKKKIMLNPESEAYDQLVNIEGFHFYPTSFDNSDFFCVDSDESAYNQALMIKKNSIQHQQEIWGRVFSA